MFLFAAFGLFAALRENNLHAEAQRLRKGRKRKLYEVTVI
jgi:hypothetical protein